MARKQTSPSSSCRITGVSLFQGELRFEGPIPALSITYDLIENAEDRGLIVHGTGRRDSWSKDVEDALIVLQQKVVADLMVHHFDADVSKLGGKKGKQVDTLFKDTKRAGTRKTAPKSI